MTEVAERAIRMRGARMVAAGLLGVCLIASCTWTADLHDVPGTFVMNKGQAHDTLVIRPDSTYHRVYVRPGAAAIVDSGRWESRRVEGLTYVAFDAFPVRWRAETFPREQSPAGVWPVIPERSITGKLKLVVDSDLGWEYVQVRRP